MTVILTDRMLEDLEFIGRNPWHPERMVCGPFDIERIDLSDEDIGLLEDIFGHGPMFAYYTLEYGTVPQLALAIKYLRYGKTIAFADRSQVRRFFDSYPVARVDISKRPLDRGVMPACDECGVDLAIHPDDPPWDVFGLPRIVSSEADYERLFAAVPNMHNGITFCTGSLGAGRENDLPKLAGKYAKRIHFAHLRQLKYDGEINFYENGHQTAEGDVDVYAIVKALVKGGFKGYVRPDHGRNVWGENAKPGYGLYDRAMGACYLTGLFEAVQKEEK